MSVPDNELISFNDIPVSPTKNKNNSSSNKSIDDDGNSEKDSIHSFNGSEDKDTERTSFDEEEVEQGHLQVDKKVVEEEVVEDKVEKKDEEEEKKEEEEEEEDTFYDFSNNQQQQVKDDDDDFGDFDDENNDDDDFGDFDDEFNGPTDDFGDFTDEPTKEQEPIKNEIEIDDIPKTPTNAELYYNVLKENDTTDITKYIDDYLNDILNPNNSIISIDTEPKQVLSTQCSQELWDRLSRDSVFFNPVTGTVGQFQWIRSETNKSYLNALGVTINYDEKALHNPAIARTVQKKRHTTPLEATNNNKSPNNNNSYNISGSSTPDRMTSSPTSHSRSASATISDGLRIVAQHREEDKEAKKEAEQEMELDIDIARAYCELTEETIRIFPDVKLNAMVVELERLQRQAGDYLDTLLDQREQLLMDAETYNDLISCIVGHAQRLREQNASKDASPAMVHKKKNSHSGFGGLIRKKTATTNSSVSMGGGVVGVKQNNQTTTTTKKSLPVVNESRRSL